MTMTLSKPIALLAFANDQTDSRRYLRNLADELADIQTALEKAGLEVRLLPAATQAQLVAEFQKYQDRIVVFHYGGHADGQQLLLQARGSTNQVAHAGGLIAFLAQYKASLKLVFVNACLTQEIASDLQAAGIAAAIGTFAPINDNLAAQLAVGFYNGLADHLPLASAWTQAVSQLAMQTKGLTVADRGMYRENPTAADYFVWNIWYADQIMTNWTLPQSPVGNSNLSVVSGSGHIVLQDLHNTHVNIQVVAPQGSRITKVGLADFKKQLIGLLDEEALVAVPEVVDQIKESSYEYDKPTLATLRRRAIAQLTALDPDPFIAQLKVFIGTLREKR